MSPKGAAKYGADGMGEWRVDEEGLPCYDWDLRTVSPAHRQARHLIGSGRLRALADQRAVLQFLAGNSASLTRLPAVGGAAGRSALGLALSCDRIVVPLIPALPPVSWKPVMRWGVGYVTYSMTIPASPLPAALSCSIRIAACTDQPYLLVDLRFQSGKRVDAGPAEWTLTARSDLSCAAADRPEDRSIFAKDSVAIADAGHNLGDVFLAGSSGWNSEAPAGCLQLTRPLRLDRDDPITLRLMLGCTETCSVQWLRQQFEGLTARATAAAIANAVAAAEMKAPELWMREDLAWCRGSLLAYRTQDAESGATILWPDADTVSPRTAHILVLGALAGHVLPEATAGSLQAVTLRQGPEGQLPDTLQDPPPQAPLDPKLHRSDTEVWFLWAWTEYLQSGTRAAALDRPYPDTDSRAPTLLARLLRSLSWIREAIGLGPHGLLRMLGGDWNGALDRVGVSGAGESVLTTAVLCVALKRLADQCRHSATADVRDQLLTWHRDLCEALGNAFRDGAFLRAYTDAGDPVGDRANGPIFTDVQAWCVMARGGTLTQRRQALDTILQTAGDGLPPLTWPAVQPDWWAALSSRVDPPGKGLNGGMSLLEAAWCAQALAMDGRTADALGLYEALALRRRAAGKTPPDFPYLAAAAALHGPQAHRQHLWPGGEDDPSHDLGGAFALAWQPYLLGELLRPDTPSQEPGSAPDAP